MSNVNIFEDDWRDCLRAHYYHVIKERDVNNETSLITVLLQTGFTEDDIAALRNEVLTELGWLPDESSAEAPTEVSAELPAELLAEASTESPTEVSAELPAEPLAEPPVELDVDPLTLLPEGEGAGMRAAEPDSQIDTDGEPPAPLVQMSLF